MALLLAALTLLTAQPEQLPSDPFLATAVRVVRGDFGPQPEWRMQAYQRGLREGVTVRGHVWLTAYYPWEGHDGRVDCKGNHCTLRTAAANRLPYGSYIWVAEPCQMRQVLDRGSERNDRIADRRGCSLWADLWMTQRMGTHITEYATIEGE